MSGPHYIDGRWHDGGGGPLVSKDPATGETVLEGRTATADEVDAAVAAAGDAFGQWSMTSFERRAAILETYRDLLRKHADGLARLIAQEAGKALWDASTEATAMANKIDISVKAYHDRTPTRETDMPAMTARLTHRPFGVMAVFGPYNFPGHLPNGHIVPALLAGNTVVYKPSDLTPAVAKRMVELLVEAGVPGGVVNLVQGGRDTGAALVGDDRIDGLLFTGSVRTGRIISRQLADRPGVIQALELGGNNPLIVHQVADHDAAALMTVLSAFISSGQRCTCARRLIVPAGPDGDAFLDVLKRLTDRITVGAWSDDPEPFMGPLISGDAAAGVLEAYERLVQTGARVIRPLTRLDRGEAFVSPGIVDVTGLDVADEEIFGPLLQVIRVPDFDSAIRAANDTRFGLASGLISDREDLWDQYYPRARAGIVNWNQQLTGAASTAPFGGIGDSGNHRPSAYYAADYCAYAVASILGKDGKAQSPAQPKGIRPETSQ